MRKPAKVIWLVNIRPILVTGDLTRLCAEESGPRTRGSFTLNFCPSTAPFPGLNLPFPGDMEDQGLNSYAQDFSSALYLHPPYVTFTLLSLLTHGCSLPCPSMSCVLACTCVFHIPSLYLSSFLLLVLNTEPTRSKPTLGLLWVSPPGHTRLSADGQGPGDS